MPTQAAQDIVNALFAGQKDLSDYVATGMNAAAVKAVDDKKQESGKVMFAPQDEGPENTEQPEDAEAPVAQTPEETPDETDSGRD